MTATLTRTDVLGFEAYALENPHVRAVVVPALGGRVWELLDRVRNRQWVWHREDVALAAQPHGSSYDDVWAGGWEQLFPNDAPGRFEGRALPDHGEWWTTAWTVEEASAGPEAVLRLACESRIRRASCSKEFRLGAAAAGLNVSYRIRSLEAKPFHFLFKEHLPVAISPSCTLALPGGRVTQVDGTFGTLLRDAGPHAWPHASAAGHSPVDLSRIPGRETRSREFIYVAELPQGWCGVDDAGQQASLRLTFDRRDLPFVWLFLTYGGWRDCYTAVLEPCTNMPKDLSAAVASGTAARLSPNGVFETTVGITLSGVPPAGR